jgi:hypothetical protein
LSSASTTEASLSSSPFTTTPIDLSTMSAYDAPAGIHLQNLILDSTTTAEQKADCVSEYLVGSSWSCCCCCTWSFRPVWTWTMTSIDDFLGIACWFLRAYCVNHQSLTLSSSSTPF